MIYLYKHIHKLVLTLSLVFIFGCVSLDNSSSYIPHPVKTIDKAQAREMQCVHLFRTDKQESGWNYASATANAIKVLKDQALVAKGNALVIENVYSSRIYRNGYEAEAASVYVSVYKCPFIEEDYNYNY